jgi:hypothetical protein
MEPPRFSMPELPSGIASQNDTEDFAISNQKKRTKV